MSAGDKTFEWYGGYTVQSESGVDLTLLRGNLELSLEERLGKHRGNVRSAHVVQKANPRVQRVQFTDLDAIGLIRQLVNAGAVFVVIGAVAMVLHGSAYVTPDLDICFQVTPTNIGAIAEGLRPVTGRSEGQELTDELLTNRSFLGVATELGPMHLVAEVPGIGDFDAVLALSETAVVCGVRVPVLSLEGLIRSKASMGRIGDKLHLLELEELMKMRDEGQQA